MLTSTKAKLGERFAVYGVWYIEDTDTEGGVFKVDVVANSAQDALTQTSKLINADIFVHGVEKR